MDEDKTKKKVFPSAEEDVYSSKIAPATPQTHSTSYRLAYDDTDFMLRDELRPVRLQLELLKPELVQQDHNINSTVVVFGSTRIPDTATATARLEKAEAESAADPSNTTLSRNVKIARRILEKTHYCDEARKLGRIITEQTNNMGDCHMVVITGGGPGIMEAANRGAFDADGKSIGLNIVLPREQRPNAYITPDLCFQFHYFAIRKMHFLKRARALVACPGGFGTLDELFETLTLIQTRKIKPVPVFFLGSGYWLRVINFDLLVEEGTIDEADLELFDFLDSAEEAWSIIKNYYDL